MVEQESTRSDKKRIAKLPIRTYLLYLLTATFLLTGVTYSKYVTTSYEGDSARVIKMGDISLTEIGDFYDAGNNRLMLTPGVNLTKKAVIDYEGSETACYLFVEVTATDWTTADNRAFSAADGKIAWSVDNFWKFLELDSGQHIYYTVLAPNEEVINRDIIKDGTVIVSDQLTNSTLSSLTTLSLTLRATAVQLDGFGDFSTEAEHAQAAWHSVKSK